MVNGVFPNTLIVHSPLIKYEIEETVISKSPCVDQMVLSNSNSSILKFKEAFMFQNPYGQIVPWAKLIFNSCIPPSKSFTLWRIMYDKLATDENLHCRGCIVVSLCSLCWKAYEATFHLFLECSFVRSIFHWFGGILNCTVDCSSFSSIISQFVKWNGVHKFKS